MSSKRYNSIDVCKLVMALCVVAIHTRPIYKLNSYICDCVFYSLVNMAVPFFFLASGFLLASKMQNQFNVEENITIASRYLTRILKLYLLWSLIYLPLAIVHYISENNSISSAVLKYIRGLIFVGEHYNSWHLWYLLSTIYSLVFIILFLKKQQSIERIVIIGFIIFIIGVGISYLTDIYSGKLPYIIALIKKVMKYSIGNGRLFEGFFYIPMGMLLSRKKIPNIYCFILFLTGSVINCITDDPSISKLLLVPSTIGLFTVVGAIDIADSDAYYIVRKMSTVIYFIHMYVWTIYYMLVYGEKTHGLDSFIVTTVVSGALSLIYIAFIKMRNNTQSLI